MTHINQVGLNKNRSKRLGFEFGNSYWRTVVCFWRTFRNVSWFYRWENFLKIADSYAMTHKFCQKQTVNMSETKQKWTRPVKINDATMGKVYQKSGGRLGTTSETWILRHKWISRKRWRSSCTQVRLMTFMRYLTVTTDLGLQADI